MIASPDLQTPPMGRFIHPQPVDGRSLPPIITSVRPCHGCCISRARSSLCVVDNDEMDQRLRELITDQTLVMAYARLKGVEVEDVPTRERETVRMLINVASVTGYKMAVEDQLKTLRSVEDRVSKEVKSSGEKIDRLIEDGDQTDG